MAKDVVESSSSITIMDKASNPTHFLKYIPMGCNPAFLEKYLCALFLQLTRVGSPTFLNILFILLSMDKNIASLTFLYFKYSFS